MSPLAQQAFRNAADRFPGEITRDDCKSDIAQKATTLQDVQKLAESAFTKYCDERRFPRARKWLGRIVGTIHQYSNILDVMAQHHPEYLALGWGAMKLVLVVCPH
jgi:hypothetical protein